jgi:hypothetical protein
MRKQLTTKACWLTSWNFVFCWCRWRRDSIWINEANSKIRETTRKSGDNLKTLSMIAIWAEKLSVRDDDCQKLVKSIDPNSSWRPSWLVKTSSNLWAAKTSPRTSQTDLAAGFFRFNLLRPLTEDLLKRQTRYCCNRRLKQNNWTASFFSLSAVHSKFPPTHQNLHR